MCLVQRRSLETHVLRQIMQWNYKARAQVYTEELYARVYAARF